MGFNNHVPAICRCSTCWQRAKEAFFPSQVFSASGGDRILNLRRFEKRRLSLFLPPCPCYPSFFFFAHPSIHTIHLTCQIPKSIAEWCSYSYRNNVSVLLAPVCVHNRFIHEHPASGFAWLPTRHLPSAGELHHQSRAPF